MSTIITLQGGNGDGNDLDTSASSFAGDPSGVAGIVAFADTTPTVIRESESEGSNLPSIVRATESIGLSGTFDNNSGNPGDAASGVLALPINRSLRLETRNAIAAGDGAGGIDLTSSASGTALEIVTTGSSASIFIEGSTVSGAASAGAVVSLPKLTADGGVDLFAATQINLFNDISAHGLLGPDAILFGAPTVLHSSVTLTSTSSGDVSFLDTLDGGFDLVVSTPANMFFRGVVGGAAPLASLTTDAGGASFVAANVTTTGNQTYNDPAFLLGASTLTSTAGGQLVFSNTVDNGGHDLTVNTTSAAVFFGAISGAGGFTQDGHGVATLMGANAYTGETHVDHGTLQVDGSIAASSRTIVASGAKLIGSGTVGALVVESGGALEPGNVSGILHSGNLSLNAGSTLALQFFGTTPGPGGYDQVAVNGSVTLAGALSVILVPGFQPTTGSTFTIIDNDGADAVSGTFTNNAVFTQGGSTYSIAYDGGDGNDVVLTALNDAPVIDLNGPGPSGVDISPIYTGNGAFKPIAPGGVTRDIDSPDFNGGSLRVHFSNGAAQDQLAILAGGGVTVAAGVVSVGGNALGDVSGGVDGTDLVIGFNSGAATPAAVSTLLDHIGYANSSADPSGVARNVVFTLGDGDGFQGTAVASANISVRTNLVGTQGDDSFTALSGNERIDALGGIDTITFGFRLVDAAFSWLGGAVLIDGPNGSHMLLSGFETYVFTDGTVNNNDGDPLVDDLFYYSQNLDVWRAHADADAHYHAYGRTEGRNPDVLFSTSTYLSLNPGVKATGADPLLQFDQAGWKGGGDPSILFDTNAYLNANPDVKAAGVDPLAHFLQYGAQEGRQPIAASALLGPNGFDYVYYLQHNHDVANAHVDPLWHFETVGWKEGRNPNALFDTAGYLAHYADVAAAHVNPLDHYNESGWHEGRDASVNFDTSSYLAAYPDVAAANINPLTHFLTTGIHEGRSAFADGMFG